MGNTQHSLISGSYASSQTERGKTLSPFKKNGRSLITSRSPNRIQENQTEFGTASQITPSKKKSNNNQQEYQQSQTEQKISNTLKTKLRNTIMTSSHISAQKEGSQNNNYRPSILERKTPNKNLRIDYSNVSNSDANFHLINMSLAQGNKLQTDTLQPSVAMAHAYPGTTRQITQKRFTFDHQNDQNMLQSDKNNDQMHKQQYLKIHEQEQHQYQQEDCDTFIKVYYENDKFVTVQWNSKNSNLTCGWLYSEVLRQLQNEYDFNKKTHIIGLKNQSNKASECYDYLLTQLESPLYFIKNKDILQIITPPEKYMIGSITSANSNFSPIFSDNAMSSHQGLTLEDFEFIKVIGKGGFSKVFQVRKKDTGKIYAMKTLSKAKIKRDNKVENILNERAILEQVSHPFIIQMKYAFQNDDYLFLLLDFCAGGELFYRLSSVPNGRMTEKQARFYFSEILLAIEYLHDTNVLYRDLKPENIVIDEHGHVKITDFGLSKLQFETKHRAYSFCGSPEYMAPEMLQTEKHRMLGNAPMYHNKSLDFYHLGAILYEIVTGLPPFFSEDRTKMYKDIMFSPITFPAFLSQDCKSLLKGLLQKNPAKRLGSQNGARDIKSHPWCASVNWDKLIKKELVPPFKPFLNKSNFDPEYTSMNPILEDEDLLVALDSDTKQPAEFLDDYANRINKQRAQEQQKLNRQHSIELYARENNTFRGYSFLQDSSNPQQQQTQYNMNNEQEGFLFCLADSKDQSFIGNIMTGSPVHEFDCLSDNVLIHQQQQHQLNQQTKSLLKTQHEADMMLMFQQESKNQQSQLSVLSEGLNLGADSDLLSPQRQTIQQFQMTIENEANFVLKQQHSKESLYNELLSTFDYSMNKKDKNIEQVKKNFNQTQSTMSLFSNGNQQNSVNNDRQGKVKAQINLRQSKACQREDSHLQHSVTSLKDKLEFQKLGRKYSPEVDMNRVLLQQQQQSHLQKQPKKVGQEIRPIQKRATQGINSSVQQLTDNNLSTRNNSANNKTNNITNVRKGQTQYTSDYGQLGNTTANASKFNKNIKKRGSQLGSYNNRASSPETNKSLGKSTFQNANQKKNSINNLQNTQQKSANHYGSVLKPSSTQQVTNSMMKTQQIYNQVQGKVLQKKKRNLSNQNQQEGNQQPQQKQVHNLMSEEYNHNLPDELKIESNYQNLYQTDFISDPVLNSDASAKFIVKKITADEMLGSFWASHSNNHSILGGNIQQNNNGGQHYVINPIGDQSIMDLMCSSSGGHQSFEHGQHYHQEHSFESSIENQEALTALILNQSNESCCCSDDEFGQKINNTQRQVINLQGGVDSQQQFMLRNESHKNIRRLQLNTLTNAIQDHQVNHKANQQEFLKTLEESKLNFQNKDLSHFNTLRSSVQIKTNSVISQQKQREESNRSTLFINSPIIQVEPLHTQPIEDDYQQHFGLLKNTQSIIVGEKKQGLSGAQSLLINPLNAEVAPKKQSSQKTSVSSNLKLGSPTAQLSSSLLTKTTPISPMRERMMITGSSKLKERPTQPLLTAGSSTSALGQTQQMIGTPKGNVRGSTKESTLTNRLAQNLGTKTFKR